MRLLKLNTDGSFSLQWFSEKNVPQYAILSHTWGTGEDDEVTFKDLKESTGNSKPGFQKLQFCGRQAKDDNLHYVWVDTCCIDKSNEMELRTAINSMFRWYQNAERCYVYLSDVSKCTEDGQVSHAEWKSAFRNSRWFTRGWTLQELLAPKIVVFYTCERARLGDKTSLAQSIHEITGIAIAALSGHSLQQYSIDERFKWAEKRQTTEVEDIAYCLLGIFDVSLPLIYGEGRENAMRRLRREINDKELEKEKSQMTDHSIPSSYYLPFSRNKKFVGRDVVLQELEQKLLTEKTSQKLAIVGLGGIGKTQIALEFAHNVKEALPHYSIFWVPALSMESMEQACGEILRICKVRPASEDQDVKDLMRQYLSNSAAKWLLIVDNADNMDLLFGSGSGESSKGLADYLPQSDNGLILFTTRHQDIAVSLAESDVIEIEEMNHEETISLLQNALIRKQLVDDDQSATNKLISELVCLPLAISQAAAYLNKNRNTSIADYLRLLRHTEQDTISLLSYEFRDSTRYLKSANAVAKTWLVSFNQLREHDTVAAHILSFISFIEWKAIPRSLLPLTQPEERMNQAIGTLCGYSFLTKRGNEEVYDAHRLVHLAITVWMYKYGSPAETITRAIQHVSKAFPYSEYTTRIICREYLPHALQLLKSSLGEKVDERYELSLKVGRFLQDEGRIREAVIWLEQSCQWRMSTLAEDHPERLRSQHTLANAYRDAGLINKAVELLEHVVAINSQIFAEDHPSRLASQHALGNAYRDAGLTKKAVELQEHVVAIRSQTLAEDHPDLLASQNALANAYQAASLTKKAVELLEHVVAIRSQTLAEDHPDLLASQNTLANAYRDAGLTKKAVELLEHVVAIYSQTFAEDHPDRLRSQHNLGIAYQAAGLTKKAVELLEHVVAIRSQTLSEDHPDRLGSERALNHFYGLSRVPKISM